MLTQKEAIRVMRTEKDRFENSDWPPPYKNRKWQIVPVVSHANNEQVGFGVLQVTEWHLGTIDYEVIVDA